jgi:hypothetical protein
MNTVDTSLLFVDEAIDGMVAIVTDLGDHLANVRPDLAGANSAFVLLTHCLGVMEFWGGAVIADRQIERDRDAEFRAYGPIAPLVARADDAKKQLHADTVALDPDAPPRGAVSPGYADEPELQTQLGVLLHIYRELAQHRGHMEVGRDLVRTR